MTFKENLIRLREEKNISAEDMAQALSCSLESLQELEEGKREPAIDEILASAKYLGVSTDFLLGNVQEDKSHQAFDPMTALAGLALPGGFSLDDLAKSEKEYDDEDEELMLELMEMVTAIDIKRAGKGTGGE